MTTEERQDHARRVIAGDLAARVCNHHLDPAAIRAVLEDGSLVEEFDRLTPPVRRIASPGSGTRVSTRRLPHPVPSS